LTFLFFPTADTDFAITQTKAWQTLRGPFRATALMVLIISSDF
jgi:hypothetical protein